MPHVRCSNRRCQARRTLNKHPDEYLRLPRCKTPGCFISQQRKGKPQRYRIDTYRQTKERGQKAPKPCTPGRGGCNGYHFPHRRGSLHCWHNPNLTEADSCEREALGRW